MPRLERLRRGPATPPRRRRRPPRRPRASPRSSGRCSTACARTTPPPATRSRPRTYWREINARFDGWLHAEGIEDVTAQAFNALFSTASAKSGKHHTFAVTLLYRHVLARDTHGVLDRVELEPVRKVTVDIGPHRVSWDLLISLDTLVHAGRAGAGRARRARRRRRPRLGLGARRPRARARQPAGRLLRARPPRVAAHRLRRAAAAPSRPDGGPIRRDTLGGPLHPRRAAEAAAPCASTAPRTSRSSSRGRSTSC